MDRRILIFLVLLTAGFPCLVRAEAGVGRLRGVVTLAYPGRSDFALESEGEGIWATTYYCPRGAAEHATRAVLVPGDEVEITGHFDRGGYAPRVLVSSLAVTGRRSLPEPLVADLARLFRGGDNCRRVSLTGIVRSVRSEGRDDGLVVDLDSRQILARLPAGFSRERADRLVDAVVRLVGVTGAARNARGQFLRPILWVASLDDIEVVEPARGDPFESAVVPLEALGRFSGQPQRRHRIRTQGTASLVRRDELLVLAGTAGGVRITTDNTRDIEPGDLVEVAGFLDLTRQIAGLSGAVARRIGRGPAPQPRHVTPDEIMAVAAVARDQGRMAEPGDFDGCLVTFPARLVETQPNRGDGGQLTLSSGGQTVAAILNGPGFGRLGSIPPGSDLRVTGVIELQLAGDDGLRPVTSDPVIRQMLLLLRNASDVVVLREPSWWTPARLAVLLAAVAAVLVAALVWAALLRRKVRSTTLRLADEMQSRRNAAVEFRVTLRERNRLAANLHDTLLQTLRGIDFQLGACREYGGRGDSDPWEHLEVARRMVNHASDELRGSVWALRTMPIVGGSFAEAIEGLAQQAGHGRAESIAVTVEGESFELPQFVAGNLLLVAQEAILNALAHADAGQIDVAVRFDSTAHVVELTVRDDGRGFEPGTQSGPAQGHFGLIGMRERIERLGGSFAVVSAAGGGTEVRAWADRRDYDARLDVEEGEPAGSRRGGP